MYPNPASEWISVEISETDNMAVSIYNMLGQQLKKKHLKEEHTTINVEDLQKGIYLLILQKDSQIVRSEKLIIN
jgi:hypothetical protein